MTPTNVLARGAAPAPAPQLAAATSRAWRQAVAPLPPYERSMPAQKHARRNQEHAKRRARQVPGRGRKQRPIRSIELRPQPSGAEPQARDAAPATCVRRRSPRACSSVWPGRQSAMGNRRDRNGRESSAAHPPPAGHRLCVGRARRSRSRRPTTVSGQGVRVRAGRGDHAEHGRPGSLAGLRRAPGRLAGPGVGAAAGGGSDDAAGRSLPGHPAQTCASPARRSGNAAARSSLQESLRYSLSCSSA